MLSKSSGAMSEISDISYFFLLNFQLILSWSSSLCTISFSSSMQWNLGVYFISPPLCADSFRILIWALRLLRVDRAATLFLIILLILPDRVCNQPLLIICPMFFLRSWPSHSLTIFIFFVFLASSNNIFQIAYNSALVLLGASSAIVFFITSEEAVTSNYFTTC